MDQDNWVKVEIRGESRFHKSYLRGTAIGVQPLRPRYEQYIPVGDQPEKARLVVVEFSNGNKATMSAEDAERLGIPASHLEFTEVQY